MGALLAFVLAAGILAASSALAGAAHAQEGDNLPFHEVARVVVNATGQGNAAVSVTLQSTSLEDILIDPALAARIAADGRLAYVALTNEESCVLGIVDESCILVSILRGGEWDGIEEIQAGAREIGDLYIDELNDTFDTRAQFHSVFIHYSEDARLAQASDRRIVSAVYTMPREDTASMYEKVGGILLSREIRTGGGFYEAARRVLTIDGSHMLFSITPVAGSQLMQMRVSAELGGADTRSINAVELLLSDPLERSDVFSAGYNPLGSIIQAVVISDGDLRVDSSVAPVLPTRVIDGEHVPLSLRTGGWVFDPIAGSVIKGKYLFGAGDAVEDDDVLFTLAGVEKSSGSPPPAPESDGGLGIPAESAYVIAAVIAAAGAGAWLIMRRR